MPSLTSHHPCMRTQTCFGLRHCECMVRQGQPCGKPNCRMSTVSRQQSLFAYYRSCLYKGRSRKRTSFGHPLLWLPNRLPWIIGHARRCCAPCDLLMTRYNAMIALLQILSCAASSALLQEEKVTYDLRLALHPCLCAVLQLPAAACCAPALARHPCM